MKASPRLRQLRSLPALTLTAACALALGACSSSSPSGGTGGSSGTGTGGSNGTGSGGSNSTGTGGANTGSGGSNSGTGGSGTGTGGAITTGAGGTTTGTGGANGGHGGANTGSGGANGGGTTGAGGANTGGSTGGGGSMGGGCAGLVLCDNFDSQTAGSPPNTSLWTLIGAKTCSTQGTPWPFAVDSTQSHSGPNSLKVSGGDSCGPLMVNTSAFTNLTGTDVYGRFYMRLSDTATTFDHAFFMALGLTSGTLNPSNQDSYLQLASEGAGNATNVFMWQTSDGNIMPEKNSTAGAQSTYPKGNTWACVEFHTSQSGTLETWVDGKAVPGLTFVPGTTSQTDGIHNQWKSPSPFKPTSIAFGWTVFSGESLTVWFDDIAVGSTRVGCQ